MTLIFQAGYFENLSVKPFRVETSGFNSLNGPSLKISSKRFTPAGAGRIGRLLQMAKACLGLGPQETESEVGISEKVIYWGSVLRRKEAQTAEGGGGES